MRALADHFGIEFPDASALCKANTGHPKVCMFFMLAPTRIELKSSSRHEPPALGNAILEVGVYATKGKSLLCVLAGLFECVVLKSAVVAVIVCDFYAVVGCELLEGALGFYCFVGR